jgi:hypothetical protein
MCPKICHSFSGFMVIIKHYFSTNIAELKSLSKTSEQE